MLLDFVVAGLLVVQPTSESEMLRIDVPDEFQIGNHQGNGQSEIVELVVPPETVNNWSTLITGLSFFGAAKIGLDNYYQRWRSAMRAACPGMKDTVVWGKVDGHPALKGVLLCPKNPETGKPENLTAIYVQGDVNLMNVQVAFRHDVRAADEALIDRIARSLKVCDQRAMGACTTRQASGFVANQK